MMSNRWVKSLDILAQHLSRSPRFATLLDFFVSNIWQTCGLERVGNLIVV